MTDLTELLSVYHAKRSYAIKTTGRLERLLESLPNPTTQCPITISLIGAKKKEDALSQMLLLGEQTSTRNPKAFNNLHVDPLTHATTWPTLLLTLGLFLSDSNLVKTLYPQNAYEIQWQVRTRRILRDLLFSRLFFLFTDIIVLFATDFGGFENVVDCLQVWSALTIRSDLPHALHPYVLIVTHEEDNPSPTAQLLEQEILDTQMHGVKNAFSGVEVVQLHGIARYSEQQNEPLRARLKSLVRRRRRARQQHRYLLPTTHLAFLFDRAIRHFAINETLPFSYIIEYRVQRPISPDLPLNLIHFLSICKKLKAPYELIVQYLAAILLKDHYVPGSHGELARTLED